MYNIYKRAARQIAIVSLLLSPFFIQCQDKNKELEKNLRQTAETINKQCPIAIDKITRLNKCESKGLEINYFYTILNDSLFDVELFKEVGIPSIKETMKNRPQVKYYRLQKIYISHCYINLKGDTLYQFTLDPSEY